MEIWIHLKKLYSKLEWAFGELLSFYSILSWRTMVSSSGGLHTHLGVSILLVAWSSNLSSIFMSILFSFLSSSSICSCCFEFWVVVVSVSLIFQHLFFCLFLISVRYFCFCFNSVRSLLFIFLCWFNLTIFGSSKWVWDLVLVIGEFLILEPWSNF